MVGLPVGIDDIRCARMYSIGELFAPWSLIIDAQIDEWLTARGTAIAVDSATHALFGDRDISAVLTIDPEIHAIPPLSASPPPSP